MLRFCAIQATLEVSMTEQSGIKIRILVAESFELVRIGLRSLFENHAAIYLVAETNCIDDLYNLVVQHKPDVILVDLQLNNGNCIAHISQLLDACPHSKVLAFSDRTNEYTHLQMFRSGAMGLISKRHSSELLLKAICAIYAGQIWFDRHITRLAYYNLLPGGEISYQSKLTNGERHIAYLACKGLSAKEISFQLSITEKTVRNQLSVIYKKIGVKKQIELCLKAPLHNYFK